MIAIEMETMIKTTSNMIAIDTRTTITIDSKHDNPIMVMETIDQCLLLLQEIFTVMVLPAM